MTTEGNATQSAYRKVIEWFAEQCADETNPDAKLNAMLAEKKFGMRHWRLVMRWGEHPRSYADWVESMGGSVQHYTTDDWEAVSPHIAFMGFRADVLEKVAAIKTGGN